MLERYKKCIAAGGDYSEGDFSIKVLIRKKYENLFNDPHTKVKERSLSYYLPIPGGKIVGYIPFPRLVTHYKMQTALSRIWTRITVSISYDDNHHTTSTSKYKLLWNAH